MEMEDVGKIITTVGRKTVQLGTDLKKPPKHLLGKLILSTCAWDLLPGMCTSGLHISRQVTYPPAPTLMAV